MNAPNTKLEKARLLAKEAEVDLTVCFNPKELQIEKHAKWEPIHHNRDEPTAMFGPTEPAHLSVNLLFDTYEEKESVYEQYIVHLEKLVHIVDDSVMRPPLSLFIWGSFCFQGVVESLSQKYTMFISNAMPVRCECSLRMVKVRSAVSRYESNPRAEHDRRLPFSRLWTGSSK
jgi:hypothetical protein